jgi:phosphate-selective porin OprO/OprP
LRLDFGAKIQLDKRRPGDDPVGFDDVELTRARVGVDGELFRVFQFSVERELTESGDVKLNAKADKTPWRDVYGELKFGDALQLRGGRFKIPFSLDQLTGVANNDFIYRSLGASHLAPARDIGGMIHGRVGDNTFGYAAGFFEHDGDNSRSTKVAGGDQTLAVRLTVRPLKAVKALNLDRAELGGNVATTDVSDASELPNGLRGRTVMSEYTFFEPVFVRGTRRRYGADLDWTNDQFGARAEYMVVTDGRDGQGLRGNNLNAARGSAYYVQGSWLLTGDDKDRPVEPRRPLLRGGAGAIEIAARYERMWFDSKVTGEPAFSNSRAEVILPSGDKALTLGVNWYLNRWVKLQLNGIHEELEDSGRTPLLDGGTKFWSTVIRAQLAL